MENDLIFERFFSRYDDTLSDDDVGALTRLFELSDNDLMAVPANMSNRLINFDMLSRGALHLAPVFIAGLLTGNPLWFRVGIITVSTFIAAERSRLAPLGVLAHTLVISAGFVAMTMAIATPTSFVIASVLLAIACTTMRAAGAQMWWTGTFTFIPVMYLACETAENVHGRELISAAVATLPYLLCASLPAIVTSIVSLLSSHGNKNTRDWLAVRHVSEMPARGYAQATIAAALAVAVAASLVELHHVHYQQWLIWSAASVATNDLGAAYAKWRDRMLGAIVGVPLGILAGILMPHAVLLLDFLIAAIALTLVAFNRYVVAFGTRCALHAVAIIVAGHAAVSADARAVDVVLGSCIGIVFVMATNWTMQSLKRNKAVVAARSSDTRKDGDNGACSDQSRATVGAVDGDSNRASK